MFVRKGVVETRTCTEVKRQQATSREKLVRYCDWSAVGWYMPTAISNVQFSRTDNTRAVLSTALCTVACFWWQVGTCINTIQQCIFIDRNQLVIWRFTVDIPTG